MSDILKQAEAIKSEVKSSKVTTATDTAQRNAVPRTVPHNEVMVTIRLVNFYIEGSLSVQINMQEEEGETAIYSSPNFFDCILEFFVP